MNEIITQTLRESAEDVAVPPLDEVALARRVRALRRRRAGKLAVGLAAAVALPAVAVPLALHAVGDGDGDGRPGQVSGVPEGSTLGTLAFVLEGTLHLQAPEQYAGGSRDTGIQVQDVVAVRQDSVLVVDLESHVLLVPFDGSAPTRPLGDQAVDQVLAAADGSIGWVGLDQRIHRLTPQGADEVRSVRSGEDTQTYDLDAGRWLWGRGDEVNLSDPDDGTPGELGVGVETVPELTDAEIAGQTIALTGATATWFADAASGELRTGPVAGRGALSSDGRWFVANPIPEETSAGMTRGLSVWDTSSGTARDFADFDDTGHVIDVAWQGDRALALVETNAGGTTLRTLYSCSVETLSCTYHYEDESGTLLLPRF